MRDNAIDHKKIVRYGWGISVVVVLIYALLHPESFSQNTIYQYLISHKDIGFLLLLVLHLLRGLVLLPSTPLIIAGALLYPEAPWSVLWVSLLGILMSSSLIYVFADKMDFKHFFSPKQAVLTKTERALSSRYGFVFIIFWSFFPAVPTDLICYVAGMLKLNYWRFIFALAIGELILCSFYIFGMEWILNVV